MWKSQGMLQSRMPPKKVALGVSASNAGPAQEVKTEVIQFPWVITTDGLPADAPNALQIETPTFPGGKEIGNRCEFHLATTVENGHVSFALWLTEVGRGERVRLGLQVTCLDSDGEELISFETPASLFLAEREYCGWNRMFTLDKLWGRVTKCPHKGKVELLRYQVKLTLFEA